MRRPIGRPSAEEAPTFGDLATLLINEYKANARRSADRVADALEHLQAFFTLHDLQGATGWTGGASGVVVSRKTLATANGRRSLRVQSE